MHQPLVLLIDVVSLIVLIRVWIQIPSASRRINLDHGWVWVGETLLTAVIVVLSGVLIASILRVPFRLLLAYVKYLLLRCRFWRGNLVARHFYLASPCVQKRGQGSYFGLFLFLLFILKHRSLNWKLLLIHSSDVTADVEVARLAWDRVYLRLASERVCWHRARSRLSISCC